MNIYEELAQEQAACQQEKLELAQRPQIELNPDEAIFLLNRQGNWLPYEMWKYLGFSMFEGVLNDNKGTYWALATGDTSEVSFYLTNPTVCFYKDNNGDGFTLSVPESALTDADEFTDWLEGNTNFAINSDYVSKECRVDFYNFDKWRKGKDFSDINVGKYDLAFFKKLKSWTRE